jgi:hypothetical protein
MLARVHSLSLSLFVSVSLLLYQTYSFQWSCHVLDVLAAASEQLDIFVL